MCESVFVCVHELAENHILQVCSKVVSSSPVYCVTKTIHVLDFAICSDPTRTTWHYVLHSVSVLKHEEIRPFPRTGMAWETNTNPGNICKLMNML